MIKVTKVFLNDRNFNKSKISVRFFFIFTPEAKVHYELQFPRETYSIPNQFPRNFHETT